jgi:hypothetical protein
MKIQLEYGTTATAYTNYEDSEMQIRWGNEGGNHVVNDLGEIVAQDTYKTDTGKCIKATKKLSNISSGTTINYADMPTDGWYNAYAADGTVEIGQKGDELGINAVALIYQLAQPKVSYYPYSAMQAWENCTIMQLPYIWEVGFYDETDGLLISDENMPIKSLVRVHWVDQETGAETPIDISTCTINGTNDGFTSTALSDGDLVWWEYEYDSSLGVVGTVQWSYAANVSAQVGANTRAIYGLIESIRKLDKITPKWKRGSSTFTNNDTAQTFTDAFCTADSLVQIIIKGTPAGIWSVESAEGEFTITSTTAESTDIDFDYYITKAGV